MPRSIHIVGSKAQHKGRLAIIKDVNKLREECSLRKIKHGEIACLYCDKIFYSYDKIRERLCYNCKNRVAY